MAKLILNTQLFCDNLIRLRKEHKYSQERLVSKMHLLGSNISRTTYSMIELGKRNIRVTDLVALQNVYQVPFEEFFKDIPPYESLEEPEET